MSLVLSAVTSRVPALTVAPFSMYALEVEVALVMATLTLGVSPQAHVFASTVLLVSTFSERVLVAVMVAPLSMEAFAVASDSAYVKPR